MRPFQGYPFAPTPGLSAFCQVLFSRTCPLKPRLSWGRTFLGASVAKNFLATAHVGARPDRSWRRPPDRRVSRSLDLNHMERGPVSGT